MFKTTNLQTLIENCPPKKDSTKHVDTLVNKSAVLRRKSLRSCKKRKMATTTTAMVTKILFAPEQWCLKGVKRRIFQRCYSYSLLVVIERVQYMATKIHQKKQDQECKFHPSSKHQLKSAELMRCGGIKIGPFFCEEVNIRFLG